MSEFPPCTHADQPPTRRSCTTFGFTSIAEVHKLLNTSNLAGFVATARPEEAKRFYESTLGLSLVEDSPYALVFESNGTTVRVQKLQAMSPAAHTILGWEVNDMAAMVRRLSSRGVKFERYDGLPQNEAGIWRTPDGSSVAWFRDPDGNTLSLTERTSE